MARVKIIARTGRIVAKGLYHLPYIELLGQEDHHSLVPAGTYASQDDLVRYGCASRPQGCIYLRHEDVFELARSDHWQGCCGPDGDLKNVLDPDALEPVAYEFADCWGSHYIRFDEGDYTMEKELPGEPCCLVGHVRYKQSRFLVGAACGQDRQEALKRLTPMCEESLRRESRHTSKPHEVLGLEVETQEATAFLEGAGRELPKWLFLKY